MNKFLLSSLILMLGLSAKASIHPCTPTQKMAPSILNCSDDNSYFTITVQTIQSPNIPACQGENFFVTKTANIVVTDKKSQTKVANIEILDGSFEYTLGGSGFPPGTFQSARPALDLKDCMSPMSGGVSVGNFF